MNNRISQERYAADFAGKEEEALRQALDIRKFEIELYWKRATYFWTFIGATFAGYGAVQASTIAVKTDLSVILSCLGTVFSFGWFCVNQGSKQWQENWENHVDMLEDSVVGPLYKIVLRRARPTKWRWLTEWIAGPAPLSVSKINQIISLFVTATWLLLMFKGSPFSLKVPVEWVYRMMIGLALLACIGFVTLGRTSMGPHQPEAVKRETKFAPIKGDSQKKAADNRS